MKQIEYLLQGKMRRILLWLNLIGFFIPTFSNAVNISLPDTMGFTTGQNINIPVTTGSLAGLGVYAYYIKIMYDPAILNCTGVSKSGTLSSPWSNPTVNTTIAGEVSIAAYGTSPLNGSGILLNIKFTVVGSAGSGTALNFVYFVYNEGIPAAEPSNGFLFVGTPTPIMLTHSISHVSCYGLHDGAINLTASGGLSPKSFLWSNGATTEDIDSLSAGTYTVTVSDNFSSPVITSIEITQPVPFFINIGSDTSLCSGTSVVLSAGSGFSQYEWSDETSQSTLLVNSPGVYWAMVQNNAGCWSYRDTITIVALSAPGPAGIILGDSVVYAGQSSIQYSITPMPGASTYLWQLPPGATGSTSSNSILVTYPCQALSGHIIVSGINECGQGNSATLYINVLSSLVIDAGIEQTICDGDTAILQATAGNGNAPYTFNWSNGLNAQSIFVTPNIDIVYTLTVTDAHGCTATDEVSVVVHPLPNVVIQGLDSLCEGSSTNLHASPASFSSYSWSPGGISSPDYYFSNASAGNHFFTVMVTDTNGCTNSAQKTIHVLSNPAVTITGETQLCVGQSSVLTANVSPANTFAYSWSTGISDATITLQTLFPGNYLYSVTTTDVNGCIGTDEVTVVVYSLPIIAIIGTDSLCEGESTTLQTLPTTFLSYLWSPGEVNTSAMSIANATAGIHFVSVQVTDTNGCTNSAQKTLHVLSNPGVAIAGETQLCDGQSSVLTANVSPANTYAYSWSTGSSDATITLQNLFPGSYLYSATIADVNGCIGTDEVNVVVHSLPIVAIMGADSLCEGESTTLLTLPTTFSSYLWSPGEVNTPVMSIFNAAAGVHVITVQVTDTNGCINSHQKTLHVLANPGVTITGETQLCEGRSGVLTANVIPAGAYIYYWEPGGSDDSTYSMQLYNPGLQEISVSVTDMNGCMAYDTFTIMVHPNPIVEILGNERVFQGDSVVLIAEIASAGNYLYEWSIGGLSTPTITVFPVSDTMYFVTVTDIQSNCTATAGMNIKIATAINVRIQLLLQGAVSGLGIMSTTLNTLGYLPNAQPYDVAPWLYDGFESLVQIPSDMTDWILVELRRAPDTTIARRAGVLLSNGIVTDTNGIIGLDFDVAPGAYYVAIKHRNHLPMMTSGPVTFPDTMSLDFTNTNSLSTYCPCRITLSSGRSAMVAGDVNSDNLLKYSGSNNDRSLILQKILSVVGGTTINSIAQGYFKEDLNLNGAVKYSGQANDPAIIIQNIVQKTGSNSITGIFSGCVPAAIIKQPIHKHGD